MKLTQTILLASIALSGLALSGCGGTSSPASAGYPDPGTVTNIPMGPGVDGGSGLRMFHNGDSFQYKVTGNITQEYLDTALNKKTVSAPISGTCVRTISAATFNGTACLDLTDNLQYTPTGGVPTVRTLERFVVQGADGSVTLIGQRDHSTNFVVAGTTSFLPGVFSTSSGANAAASFVNDASDLQADKTLQYTLGIVGQESVLATSGSFNTWKSTWSSSDTSNYYPIPRAIAGVVMPAGFVVRMIRNESGAEWWAPALGTAIKSTMTVSEEDTILKSWTYTSGTFSYVGDILRTNGTFVMTLQSRTLN